MSSRAVNGLAAAGAPVIARTFDPRGDFLVSSWIERPLPDREYLLGTTMCTTSRWILFGDTGIGKTLLAFDMAGAIAAGHSFLNWVGRRPARVMYLDGELPAETFKERMQLVAQSHGADVALYGYNRETLPPDAMPPLNTDAGQAWLMKEIEAVKPDVIFFDSIMCLLIGPMSEEEVWAPMKPFVRALSARRIAQVWLNHTGHDASRNFGTKTREWEMDTVVSLSKGDDDGQSVRIEFRKARLRTPENAAEFAPRLIRFADGEWIAEGAAPAKPARQTEVDAIRTAITNAYDRLAEGVTPAAGFDGASVRKVNVDVLRDEVKSRGFLDTKDTGGLTPTSRSHFHRAKTELISKGRLVESDNLIWRAKA